VSVVWGGLGLWFPVYHPESIFTRWPQLWHSVSVRSLLHLLARLRIVHLCETRPLFTLQSRRSKCDFSQIKKKIQFSLALALSLSEKLETRPSSSRAFKTGCTRNPTRIWTFVKLPFLSGFPLKWRNRKYFCSLIYGSFTQNRPNFLA